MVQFSPEQLPPLAPGAHLALPPQGRRRYRVFRPDAVAAGGFVSMVPVQDRQADVPSGPDQVDEFRFGPVGMEGWDPAHVGRCLVSHEPLTLDPAVQAEKAFEELAIGNRLAGAEQSLELL